jgi:hypothetical protein
MASPSPRATPGEGGAFCKLFYYKHLYIKCSGAAATDDPGTGEKKDSGAVFRHFARYFLTNSATTGSSPE